jgi:hypothetical protein
MIHFYDNDERQRTDAANYPLNHGSFSEVSINMNKALRRLSCYSEPDEAEWVGMVASLETNFKYKNKKNFILHAWEATSMPVFVYQQAIMTQCKIFGVSDQITNLWHKYNRPNVKTIYLGCDTDFWYQTKDKNPNQFQFFHINSTNVRSGLDLTIQAFCFAFQGNSNVKLVIKDTNPNGCDSKLSRKILELVKKFDVNIEYITKRESMLWIRDMYSESHVTLNLLRATSFGMPLLECGACNSLCVTGDIAPTNEIIKPHHGILIPPSGMIPLASIIPHLESEWGLLNCYGWFQHIEEPYFADYNVNSYAEILQTIYNKWDKYSKIDTRTEIVENWKWDKFASRLRDELCNTSGH